MELDANVHPPLITRLVFPSVTLETSLNDSVSGDLELRFRSFLPDERLLRLECVSLDATRTPSVITDAHLRATYYLRVPVQDSTGAFTLQPFRAANERGAFERTWTFCPLPGLDLTTAEQRQSASIWVHELPLADILHPYRLVPTTGTRTSERAYPIEFVDRRAELVIYSGENTTADRVGRRLLARLARDAQVEPQWVSFPDAAVSVTLLPPSELEDLQRETGLLFSLISGLTSYTTTLDSIHYPTADGYAHHCCLFRERPFVRHGWMTLPIGRKTTLAPVLAAAWPRYRSLARAGFNANAVTGWFDRGKIAGPIEQGFLNLFIYLEALKHHWQHARHGRQAKGSFAGYVNSTLRDVLGVKRTINSLAEFRDRIVHEGVTGIPHGQLWDRYVELYAICAASYVALLGWTGQWNAFRGNELRPQPAYWTPPILSNLPVSP